MQHIDAAHQCYFRLLAAQRVVSDEERAEIEKTNERERLKHRINRRLPKVY